MGPKRRRKGKKKVGGAAAAAAGEEAAAARDEDAAGPSHAAAGEASSGAGGGADGGSPASRAASPPTTAAGGQGGGGPVSGGGGSAPGGAETAQRQGAPPAAVTSVQGAPRAPASTAATVPQGSPRRTVAAQSAPSGAAAMAQSAPGGSATGQTATAQSSPRAATSTQALMNEGFLHLDKSVSNNLEEEGPAFGDAQRRKKAIGVDNDDSNRDDADGGRDPNKSLSSEIVLSWTIQDILLDDEAHKSKVVKIPTHFKGVDEYLGLYSQFILEETWSNLKVSLQNLTSSAYYDINNMLRCESSGVFFVDINLKKIELKSTHSYRVAQDGDVFLFSSHPHSHDFDSSLDFLGIAFNTSQCTSFHRGFKVLVSDQNCTLYCEENGKFGIFLINIMDALKAWSVFNLDKTEDNCSGIKSMLNFSEMAKTDCKMCDMSFDYEKIKLSHLNQQQLYSLKSIISAVHCRSNKHIELIQGPPGSGKTEITIALLQVLHHMNLKVLLCAPKTNIVKFLTNLDKCLFPLEDALVLDNLDSTELAKEFQRLCLCHRSQDFLVGITLFKKWLREMFVLLNLDPYCTEKCDHEPTRIRCSTNSLLVFTLSSFKEKFTKLLMRKEWLTNLKERFSEIYLSADIANDITNLLSLLKDFEDLLCHERLQDKRVQWTFGLSSVPCKLGGNSAARKLNDLRLQYVDFIQRFRSSLKLPKLEERKSLEDFCIKHAKVIISTTQSTFRLHEAAMEPINLFIVDDAAKINECDLIIPLRLPVTHILMLGDDFNLQPSKVWENARFSMNPFKRLLNLGFRKHMLTEQYAIHPSIWQFPNEKFYEGRITNGATVVSPEYNKQFKGLKFPNYCFIDVTGTDGPSCKNTIELATIQYMLKIISQGLEDTEVIDVGVLCLCGSYVGGIKSSLGKKYATHNKINVHIESADSFEGETYHLVILSMLFKDENTILQIEKINAALTRARHCLWMFGEVDSVSDRGGIFAELVHDVIERKCILKWNTITTIQSKYALESDNFHGSSSASSNETIHQVCTEFTWSGRPKRTKYILAPLRDQGNSDTCTMHSCLGAMESMYKHQYACLEPPQDFSWILSTDNLKEEYENVVAKEIGSEEIEKKGKHRLATVLEILKEPGVLGSRKQQPEVVSNFKIKSHSQLPIKEDQEIKTVFDTVKDGKILVGHFHMSENFFSLRPGEIYHYDRQKPYLNPVSSLQASHAVMIIGSGVTMTKVKKRIQCAIHLSLQNSAGRLVGENGCGYVGLESIRGLYQLDI
uniref:DNA2/NAM7 helicase-like C-terminal domain-containing protein n=1 Tax=Oryza sativa subsp. japonica TaxID=39947 RepID=Q2R0D7_ORYSJ|nr:hypothetical protein LOC_Os11g42910 [Oryza sativa Japonica Group]